MISKDVLTCPLDEIKNIDALLTVVGGATTYRGAGF
jgi:predicted amidohydrolase YtcJ